MLARHREFPPAALRALAVGRDVDERTQHHLGVQAARLQAMRALAKPGEKVLLDRLTPLFVVLAVRQLGVVGEQRRHVGPQPELRVLRVRFLESFDRSHRFGALDVLRQAAHACGRAHARTGVSGDDHLEGADRDEQHKARGYRAA